MNLKSLKGKTAWITGGKRIGQSIAVQLAEFGADLIISYRSSEKEALETAKKAKKFGHKIFIIKCDVSSRPGVEKAVKEIRRKTKKLDILILLASIFRPVQLKDISDKEWDDDFSIHVKGTFWPIKFCLPLMPAGSHIITVADRTSIGQVYPGYLTYVATKAAVAAMTRALAVELGPKGIFVNAVAPGPILKPDDISKKEWQRIRSDSIIKYPITDEEAVQEFVETVLRLCFVRSSGSVYPLDLGYL